MTIYHKPVRLLMYDMVDDLKIKKKQSFCTEDAIEWFKINYSSINKKTVKCHLIKMSTNAPSRLHFNVIPLEDDLFFKIDTNHFRLFEKDTDPSPIWDKNDITHHDGPFSAEGGYLERLKNIGFKLVGHWIIKDEKIFPQIHSFNHEKNILYAFIVLDEVKYIGKSSQSLSDRLKGYINPGKTQHTNIRNNAKIKEILSTQNNVSIYVFTAGSQNYKGFNLSLAAGLEDSIIETIKPKWNKR